jgi:toxin ParE1/3/4
LVKWSPIAKADLKEIYTYISRDSKYYAKSVVNEITSRVKGLESYPRMGRTVEEYNDPDVRELVIYSYRLIYGISNNDIEIITLIHSRMNYIPD